MKLTVLLLVLTLHVVVSSTANSSPNRHRSSLPPPPPLQQQRLELTQPLPTDTLIPSCTHSLLLNHSFANSLPPITTVPYSPPPSCPPPWNYVLLHLQATAQGLQHDRIAGLWFGGVEVLRTSTAEPNEDGIYWSVKKDVTKYASLFARSDLDFSMMLIQNMVNATLTGVYYVNVTLEFYQDDRISPAPAPAPGVTDGEILDFGVADLEMVLEKAVRGNYGPNGGGGGGGGGGDGGGGGGGGDGGGGGGGGGIGLLGSEMPADLIIPLSDESGALGFWYRFDGVGDLHFNNVELPLHTRRAVVEIYVSAHGLDEFWYSNPPDSYISANNLTTERGNGAFREVYLAIDGRVVGSVIPIPVIYTGGFNPLFWEPVVAIGAFNIPTYEIDVTPFLGDLLDGASHRFEFGVLDSIPFWLVDANLHLWIDYNVAGVQAGFVSCQGPSNITERKSEFKMLDGTFEIEAKRKSKAEGWVMTWDQGNLTTTFEQKIKFQNKIKFKHNGKYKIVKQSVTSKTEVKVTNLVGDVVARASLKRKYPIEVITSSQDQGNNTYVLATKVVHSLKEKFSSGNISTSITNSQTSDGWILEQDHNVLNSSAKSNQSFIYIDNYGCYTRNVAAVGGRLIEDNTTVICPNAYGI